MPFSQEELRSLWLSAPPGRLCPWEQARALGLREASKLIFDGEVNQTWIAGKLAKTDGSAPMSAISVPEKKVSEKLQKAL